MTVKDTKQSGLRRARKQVDEAEVKRCIPARWLFQFADNPLDMAPEEGREHVAGCVHCAESFTVFHAAKLLSALPLRWTTHLGSALRGLQLDDAVEPQQLLGAIQFDDRTFAACHEEEWVSSATAMRVNLVFDRQGRFFSLSILDVPLGIASIAVLSPEGLQPLIYDEEGDAFELTYYDGVLVNGEERLLSFEELRTLLSAHKLEIVIDMKPVDDAAAPAQPNDVIEVLHQHQAIERYADYVLPSGWHCDTYINSSSLCSSEESMHFLAAKLDFLFWDKHFDTVLANGWAMGLIARRLAAARAAQGRQSPTRQVLCEGYQEPILLDDIIPGSQVIIIVDVVITGRLALELKRIVQAAGADVVGIAAIVRPHGTTPLANLDLRVLCEVEMSLSVQRPVSGPGSELPQRVFNPIAGCMTTRSTSPRSPSEFLLEDPSAKELWSYVQAAEAYEHHRREGDTHYIGFIDTKKLMECSSVGKDLVTKLAATIFNSGNRPAYLLTPHRSRAGLLAEMMTREFRRVYGFRPQTIVGTRRWTTGQWELQADDFGRLHDADVLIVDTAAGHGRTIDQLASLAAKAKARRIGAAVLLSRLTPPCADAFNLRLTGGFHRLFNLPIRPVAIRGDRIDLCPVCRRKDAIRRFAKDSDIEALEQWADSLFRLRGRTVEPVRRPREKQLMLFELEKPFLSACGPAVASGVTLHALGAASANGSAPLSLPELFDERISWRVRATMVENLPAGILEWSGNSLLADLVTVLDQGEYPSVWKAAASLLAREGNDVWLNYLEAMLSRAGENNQ
ncbi:MAG: hypothetical protein AB7F89_16010, partial [Pirellulaceae bacterium]